MHMKNVHRGFKKYKCDDYGKNFTQNIGLKGHITWKKDSIVMNVANIFIENPIWECIYKLFMKKTFNCNVITVEKISPKPLIWKNLCKLFMNHTKHWIEIINYSCSWKSKDSIVINVAKFLLEYAIWKSLYKIFMNLIVNTVTKILSKHLICKDINKLFMNLTKYWLEITNYRCS